MLITAALSSADTTVDDLIRRFNDTLMDDSCCITHPFTLSFTNLLAEVAIQDANLLPRSCTDGEGVGSSEGFSTRTLQGPAPCGGAVSYCRHLEGDGAKRAQMVTLCDL